MKTKIKRHSRSAMSVVLAICMLISCMTVGLIATDAAKLNEQNSVGARAGEAVGYSDGGYVKGSWDSWATPDDSKGHNITNGYTVSLAANKTYEFCFVAIDNNDTFKKNGVTITTSTTNYDFDKSATENAKLKTTVAGNYTFKFSAWNGENCMRVNITFPSAPAEPDTWTVVGGCGDQTNGSQTDALFTSSWVTTLTQNDMTNTSGTTWTWTKNNVTLPAGKILCKVVKNHSYDTAYPTSGNKESESLAAGQYNVTITFNSSTKAITIEATSVAKSTLSVKNNIANATVTATYNGTTVGEGQSISNVPQGATVSISVTPATGYQCTGITSSGGGTITGSINSYTLTMPATNTTVDANITTVTLKRIYFNNNYTQYGTVYAYVYNKSGSTKTYEYLGKRPGKVMLEADNSEMWYIEVPSDITYVEFISGDGKTTDELTIDWTQTCPKYIPPYNYDAPTVANGGTWGNYKWGDKVGDQRDNVYDVTKGSTMSASNLFTGISGTLFDYYVDHEVTSGWLQGLTQRDYDNYGVNDNDPYTKLNANLSAYADADKTSANANWSNPSHPKYGITYPLYFGNLNVDAGNALVSGYYDFVRNANNSNTLTHNNYAVTGLSGNKLGDDDTIHYYKSGATNENGAPMAMFNEDFLSGENKTGDTLATILRTSSFPVRKEGSVKTLCLDMSSHQGNWEDNSAAIVANFHNGNTTSGNLRVMMIPYGSHKYYVEIPSGYTQVEWLRFDPAVDYTDSGVNAWNYKNVQSFGANNTYTFSSGSGNSVTGSWSKNNTLATGHDYYEYDSTYGKDNAFITNISTSEKTATIDYYDSASGKSVKSTEKGTKGFFPFDYNNVISNSYDPTRVYLKPNSDWKTANAWFAVVFKKTGLNDARYQMNYDTSLELYYYDIPSNYKGGTVDFCRMNPSYTISNGFDNNWQGKWNDTGFVGLPTDNKVVRKVTGWDNSSEWESNDNITVPKTNGFADSSTQNAHDDGFGMKLEIPFTLNGSGAQNGLNTDGTHQVFSFSGDDDLWVFVDDKLVLDLGGAHARTTGFIDFSTKSIIANNKQAITTGVTRNGSFADGFNTNPNYVHTMTIYYMERGMFESNLKFGFSFHAIPNQFWIDKKIRTKDRNNQGYDTLNAGFFTDNNQSGDDSNMTTHTLGEKTTTMSKFEKSFQDEQFTVKQWYGTSSANTLASGKNYTIDYNDQTQTVDANGQYPIYHDKGNAFIGQFTTGNKFKLTETTGGSNKYVYTPVFSVWDQANNDKAITTTGDNTNGYTFDFNPTQAVVTGGIENTNIKARFENYMVAHDLTLTKEITNAVDTTTDFTFQILFDFTGNAQSPNYVSYPLFCDVDGVRTKLSDTGTITVKAGQVIDIFEIPENAKIQVTEVLTDTVSGYRYDSIALTKGSEATPVTPTDVTKGIQFVMGDDDMSAVIKNKKPDNKYTITYNYPSYGASPKTSSLYGDQSYTVTGVFTEDELNTYMSLSGTSLVFTSTELEKTFINNKAPYEDNFMQTLSFANSTITKNGTGWDANGDYSSSVTATGTADYTINAYFNLPYAVNGTLVPQEYSDTHKVAKTANTSQGSKDITCFDWYVTSGPSNAKGSGTPVYVKAPLILYVDTNTANPLGGEGDTAYYFQYWSVKSQGGYGKPSVEYTRCYDYEFNFALFMDSIIEPVYATSWAQPAVGGPTYYNNYDRYNPELQITACSKDVSIAFLENSRNQYNNNGCGSRTVSTQAADVIYSDFLLSFNYDNNGLVQLNTLNTGTKTAGLVIEAVNYMDYETGSTTVFDYNKNYSDVSTFTANETTQRTAITNWLTTGTNKPSGCAMAEFDVKKLDNKNCIQYYYALNNRANNNGMLLNTMQNRYKVFRAYAYIGDGNVSGTTLTNVKLSTPVYFTIYDVGSQGLVDNANKPNN